MMGPPASKPPVISSTSQLKKLHVFIAFLYMAECARTACVDSECGPAEGWDNFANNLGSDLAPLLALFGEQVTKQFMSESLSWVDSLLFSLAPLGIITAIVSAIRVGGGPKLRSLVGRAKESRGEVEADLMSSTSSDVCELWNGEGVVRVLGRPFLLQLIYEESELLGAGDSSGLYTFQEAIHTGLYHEKGKPSAEAGVDLDPDVEKLRGRQNPPNLSLNVSMKPLPKWILVLFVVLGILLQGGVLVYAAVSQYILKLQKNNNQPIGYGFPLFLVGTVTLAVGMFLCAQVVDLSTEEKTWVPVSGRGIINLFHKGWSQQAREPLVPTAIGSTVIWLQQGGQTVGDQRFESFARRTPGNYIITSHKPEKTNLLALVTIGITTALLGFFAQFIALRAMHSSVTAAQLGAVLFMTVIRSCTHIQRESGNDIKYPDQVEGHELDWLAKDLETCKAWEVISGLVLADVLVTETGTEENGGVSGVLPHETTGVEKVWLFNHTKISAVWNLITGVKKSKITFSRVGQVQRQNIAIKVMKIRTRLAGFSKDWNLGNRDQVQILQNAIEATINGIYSGTTLKDESKGKSEVKWALPVKAQLGNGSWQNSGVDITISRSKDENGNWKPWKVKEGELEAVLCLWVSSLAGINRERAEKGFPRLRNARCVGLASSEDIMDYNMWIYRGTTPETSFLSCGTRYFGRVGGPENAIASSAPSWRRYLYVNTEQNLERVCAQELYSAFMFWIAGIIEEMGGKTERRTIDFVSGDKDLGLARFGLTNTKIASLADNYYESGLGTVEEAYIAIIPALRAAGKIPLPHMIYEQLIEPSSGFGLQSSTVKAFEIDLWLYLNRPVGLVRLSVSKTEAELENRLFKLTERLLRMTVKTPPAKLSPVRRKCLVGLKGSWEKVRLEMDSDNFFRGIIQIVVGLFVLRECSPDIAMGFSWFALQKDKEVEAEILARLVWDSKVSGCGNVSENISFEAAQALRTIFQRKGVFMPINELQQYLDNLGLQEQAAEEIIKINTSGAIGDSLAPADLIKGWRTPLQAAAGAGHLEDVERFLGDINAKPIKGLGQTALQAVAEAGSYLAKFLLAASASIYVGPAGYAGRTALQAAAEAGHLDIVELLLKEKADVNAKPADHGQTALQAAAGAGHLDIVELLLKEKAEVNAKPADHGRTALQVAAEAGQLEIVKLLLKEKADVNAKPAENSGRTALQAAAGAGHLDIVELLLKEKAEVNAKPADHGQTALQAAAEAGHLDIVELLLKEKAEVNAKPADHGRTALQVAAEAGQLEIVKLLLKEKADVNAKPAENSGRTALQAAAGAGHLDIVELLLKEKAEVNAEPAECGRTALQAAAEAGHLDIIELLLKEKADVNAKPAWNFGRTALQAAAEAGHLDIVELLLKEKAEVNANPAWNFGRTALQAAAGADHLDIVELLLKEKADVNAKPADHGRTALQAAAEAGHLDIVELLLKEKAEVNAEPVGDSGRTALQAAAEAGHLGIVELLLKEKAEVNAKPAEYHGRTALQAAAGTGHLDIVELLLKEKAEVNAEPAGDSGRTALQAAAEAGHLDIVELLLKEKAEVNAEPAECGRTALQAAAGAGHLDIVELLLKEKAEVNAEPAKYGWTALQAAAEAGHLDIVELLLKEKAEVNAEPAEYGRTALQAAAGAGHLDIVELLLKEKAEVNVEPAGNSGRTALQAAAEAGHLDIVELLLKEKAEVNAKPADHGRTALQAAAAAGHLDIVELLLKEKAEVNAEPAEYGRTALQAAAEAGHLDIVELLLKEKAEVNAEPAGNSGRTALQAAAGAGHLDIVELLLKEKAEVNAEPAKYGWTALQAAAEAGHLDIVELLLKEKAEVNAEPAEYGWTALQAAVEAGHLDIVELLLKEKADVNAGPAGLFGRTALQAAAEAGHVDIVQTLLHANADIHMKTSRGRTARDLAEKYGHLKVVELLDLVMRR